MATKRITVGFSTNSHPRFGRKYDDANPPKTTTKSPYYWWFKFLQLNEDYKATCLAEGLGEYSEIYADLGNVHGIDFKSWWDDKRVFFAEQPKKYKMVIAQSPEELAPFNSEDALNVVVPLDWSQRSLRKKFNSLVLSKVEPSKRGLNTDKSTAKYKLSGRWHIEAMEHAYHVYVIKHTEQEDTKKLAWADIAIRAKLKVAKDMDEGKITNKTADERRVATIVVMRDYKRALDFIQYAASMSFPYKK
jgi:hypothetical protein